MELKDKGTITIDRKGNKKQIKCHKFMCNPLNRELMVHRNEDNKNQVSISDCLTGYRLFNLPQKIEVIKPSEIVVELKKFIAHYTKEGIAEEFKRIEELQSQGK